MTGQNPYPITMIDPASDETLISTEHLIWQAGHDQGVLDERERISKWLAETFGNQAKHFQSIIEELKAGRLPPGIVREV